MKRLRFTLLHKPLQHCQVKGHLIPHKPQLLTSEDTTTQRFRQHNLLILGYSLGGLQIQGLYQHPARWFTNLFNPREEDEEEEEDFGSTLMAKLISNTNNKNSCIFALDALAKITCKSSKLYIGERKLNFRVHVFLTICLIIGGKVSMV